MHLFPPRRGTPRALALSILLALTSAALLALPAASQAAEATASLSPPCADTFPDVVVGKSDPQQQFVLTNNGPEEIMVEGVSVNGANPNDFSLENDGCATVTLSSGESCSLYISFTPSAQRPPRSAARNSQQRRKQSDDSGAQRPRVDARADRLSIPAEFSHDDGWQQLRTAV